MPEEKVSIKIKDCFLSLFHLTITYQDIWENNPKKKKKSKQANEIIDCSLDDKVGGFQLETAARPVLSPQRWMKGQWLAGWECAPGIVGLGGGDQEGGSCKAGSFLHMCGELLE